MSEHLGDHKTLPPLYAYLFFIPIILVEYLVDLFVAVLLAPFTSLRP